MSIVQIPVFLECLENVRYNVVARVVYLRSSLRQFNYDVNLHARRTLTFTIDGSVFQYLILLLGLAKKIKFYYAPLTTVQKPTLKMVI